MAYDFTDKSVLITGSNRGIGKAILESCLKHGARKVYAGVRLFDSALPLAEVHGDRIQAVKLDLLDTASIQAAAIAAKDVDIVINNAGVLRTDSLLDENALELFDEQMQVNVHGLWQMAKAFAPVLKANGGGIFVQLNSVASLRSFQGLSTYCASKAAAYSMTQGLRDLLAEQGTRIISVHPGPIATDMGAAAGFEEGAEAPEVVAEALIKTIEGDEFHCFPDQMARDFWEAFQPFSDAIVTASNE